MQLLFAVNSTPGDFDGIIESSSTIAHLVVGNRGRLAGPRLEPNRMPNKEVRQKNGNLRISAGLWLNRLSSVVPESTWRLRQFILKIVRNDYRPIV
ncbi:MAG: hypothetical protein KDA91_15840 [Planctomycetaceae bacterium]|nr:hypothetical protein [Planctomycetaceae bacterium]